MEIVLFTVIGIALYLISNQLLLLLEKLNGNPLPQRSIVFFVIIITLALPTFSIMRSLVGGDEGTQNDYQEQQATDGRDQPAQTH